MEGKAGVSGFSSSSTCRRHGLGGDVFRDFGRGDTGFWFSFSTGVRRRRFISLSESKTQQTGVTVTIQCPATIHTPIFTTGTN